MDKLDKLKENYAKISKHSSYQILASNFNSLICINDSQINSRYEKERFKYIAKKVDFFNKKVADIGGNTGYFSFESINSGANKVFYHAEFVSIASELLELQNKINVCNQYYSFEMNSVDFYEIMFLLNVLHHVGDDYGDNALSIELAQKEIINSLKIISRITKILILQLGFNWKGNVNFPLFKNGSKVEQLRLISDKLHKHFELSYVGVAIKNRDHVIYCDINDENIKRFDTYGEFLNRPLFILKSKKFGY